MPASAIWKTVSPAGRWSSGAAWTSRAGASRIRSTRRAGAAPHSGRAPSTSTSTPSTSCGRSQAAAAPVSACPQCIRSGVAADQRLRRARLLASRQGAISRASQRSEPVVTVEDAGPMPALSARPQTSRDSPSLFWSMLWRIGAMPFCRIWRKPGRAKGFVARCVANSAHGESRRPRRPRDAPAGDRRRRSGQLALGLLMPEPPPGANAWGPLARDSPSPLRLCRRYTGFDHSSCPDTIAASDGNRAKRSQRARSAGIAGPSLHRHHLPVITRPDAKAEFGRYVIGAAKTSATGFAPVDLPSYKHDNIGFSLYLQKSSALTEISRDRPDNEAMLRLHRGFPGLQQWRPIRMVR